EALRMTGDDPTGVHRLRLAAAMYHFDAGEPTRARTLVEQALAEAEPGVPRAQALLHLGDLISTGESVDASRAAYVGALSEAGDDVALRAALETRLARIAHLNEGSRTAERHARAAVALAKQAKDPSLLAQALIGLALEK